MHLAQHALLSAYYRASWPARRFAAWQRARRGRAPVMVLFYHRVADSEPNDWTLQRADFARQIRWLERRFDLISLAAAERRIASGHNARPAVSLTFDDGYGENCDFALPLLVEKGIPCTYFVSTDNVLTGRPFPHDQKRGRPLPVNSIEQLRFWADKGIEIGAHTRTHADLGAVNDPVVLHDETVLAARDLSDALGRPLRYFAFPYGQPRNINGAAAAMLRGAGIRGVCSAYGGYNFPGDDPFHIRRIHADPELVRLKNWLTLDPRKLRQARQSDAAAAERLRSEAFVQPAADLAPAGRSAAL